VTYCWFLYVLEYFFLIVVHLVVISSAINCLETRVFEMSRYMSSETLDCFQSHTDVVRVRFHIEYGNEKSW